MPQRALPFRKMCAKQLRCLLFGQQLSIDAVTIGLQLCTLGIKFAARRHEFGAIGVESRSALGASGGQRGLPKMWAASEIGSGRAGGVENAIGSAIRAPASETKSQGTA